MTLSNHYLKPIALLTLSLCSQAMFANEDEWIDVSAVGDYPAEIAGLEHVKLFAGINELISRDTYTGTVLYQMPPFVVPVSGTAANSKTQNTLPSIFLAMPLAVSSHKLSFGFGVFSPTDSTGDIQFPLDSVLRYNYTRSFFSANSYTAVLSYKVNDIVSIGAGIDRNRIRVKYDAAVPSNLSGIPTLDNQSVNNAEGWGTGWHGSILAKLPKTYTLIELAYRSKSHITSEGGSNFMYQKTPMTLIINDQFSVPITVPEQFKLKLMQPLSEKFLIAGTYIYTRWNVIDILPFRNIAMPLPPSFKIDTDFNFFWKNTSSVILGSRYRFNDQVYLTGVGGWSESQYPLSEDFYMAGFDLGYNVTKNLQLIFNYYHQFSYNYDPIPIGDSILDGRTKASKDIVGIKLQYLFSDEKKITS